MHCGCRDRRADVLALVDAVEQASSAIDDYLSDGDVANLIEARQLMSGEGERT
jgi:hypothetical protein